MRDLTKLFKKYGVGEIRILPMDKKREFPARDQAEDFFAADLPADGIFYYQKRGIRIRNPNALVLFQYDNEIIACAVLEEAVPLKSIGRRPCTAVVNGCLITYHGYYRFYPDSVRLVRGITAEELRKTVEGFKGFSQAKQFIGLEYRREICRLLCRKRAG